VLPDHISQTDNIIILIMSLIVFFTETHLDNQVLDSDVIIEGFETPSSKNRDSRGGRIITYDKSCVNLMEDGQYIFIRNIGCASWARVYFNIAR
jgi:hypothetical protein